MRRRRCLTVYALVLALVAVPVAPMRAQMVLGPQDDALVLPRGVFRIRLLNQWVNFNERYGAGTPGRPTGALEPLGIDFTRDTIGVEQFPSLGPVELGLRSLTGIPEFTLSLGQTLVNSDVSITITPIVFELGVTDRLSMGLVVPYVRTRNDIFFEVNPTGTEGNVGFNPAEFGNDVAIAQNAEFQAEFQAALEALRTQYAACFPNNTSIAGCANVLSLYNNAARFAGGVTQIWGNSPFVPLAGTQAQLAIVARIAAFNSFFQQFLDPNTTYVDTPPFPAQAPLTVQNAQEILTNPAFGIAASPLETVESSHIGDVELGAKFLLYDSFVAKGTNRLNPTGFNWRASVGTLVRFGTGETDSPDNFVDVATGNGQTDIELRGYADLLFGSRFWTSFIARYGWQLADEQIVRIADRPEQRLTALFRRQEVERDLGDFYEFEVNPRVAITPSFGVMGHYFYRHKAEDNYSGTFQIDSAVTGYADITLDARTLNLETEVYEHRLGFGASYSTVAAFQAGRARFPLEVTYFHFQTTRGIGGNVPKLFSDQIQVRVYTRLFGGP